MKLNKVIFIPVMMEIRTLLASNRQVHMQTATCTVKNLSGECSISTHVILDCGSQRTHATEKLLILKQNEPMILDVSVALDITENITRTLLCKDDMAFLKSEGFENKLADTSPTTSLTPDTSLE